MLPWPSNATPRGLFSPPTTGAIVQLVLAEATPPPANSIATLISAADNVQSDLEIRIKLPPNDCGAHPASAWA
jgi:hypothetical protein